MKKLSPHFGNLAIASISLAIFFIILAYVTLGNSFSSPNMLTNQFFSTHQNPLVIEFSIVMNYLFDPWMVLAYVTLLSCWLLLNKQKSKVLFLITTILASTIIFQALKLLTQIPRPSNILINEPSFSFPSGHATTIVVLIGLITYLFINKIKSKPLRYTLNTLSIILMLLVSLSRLILNAHWLSDVVASLLLGLALVTFSIHFYHKNLQKTK